MIYIIEEILFGLFLLIAGLIIIGGIIFVAAFPYIIHLMGDKHYLRLYFISIPVALFMILYVYFNSKYNT
jgi:hypothetical protein